MGRARMLGWPLDGYETWLRDTLTRLAAPPDSTP